MTFDDLHQVVAAARQSRTLALEIADFAPAAAETVGRLVDTTRLQLSRVNVAQLVPDEVRLTGAMQLGLRIACELRFFREGSGIGYAMTFATANPLELLPKELEIVADIVDLEALWWTASSRLIAETDIAIGGLEARAVEIRQGFDNFHLRLKSPILDLLSLGGAVFSVAMDAGRPRFSVARQIEFRLPPAVARFDRLSVSAKGEFEFDGEILLTLLGVSIPPLPTVMVFARDSVRIRVPVPDPPKLPRGFPFQAIALESCFAGITGALGTPSYGIAMDGRYILPGGGGRGGAFRFEYSAGNATPVPDTAELSIDKLTVTDVINLLSPVPVRLPGGIDSLVSLRDGYAYYAAKQGVASARAGIDAFGARAYLAAEVRQGALRASLMTNPLKLGSVVALRGTGVRTPAEYTGAPFDRDAIGIEVDTAAGTAKAALIVDFMGSTISRMEGRLEQGAIAVKTRTSLPAIADVPLEVVAGPRGLQAKGAFAFRQAVDLPLDYGFHFKGLASFSGTFAVTGDLGGQPTVAVVATIEVAGFSLSLPFEIDPDRLRDLAVIVVKRLGEEVVRQLLDALKLVEAFLKGALEYTLAAAETARRFVAFLAHTYNAGAEEVIALMHRAGASAGQALALVREGAAELGRFVFTAIVDTLRTLYSAAVALETLREWAAQFARTVGREVVELAENLAWLMHEGGFALAAIADEAWRGVQGLSDRLEHFARALMCGGLGAGDIAKRLQGKGALADSAGLIIGRIFGTIGLEAVLAPAFGPFDAARVARDVERELGRVSRNVGDELGRFWGRLGIRF